MDSTPLDMNTNNEITSPSDSIPVRKKSPNHTSPALPMELPEDPNPDPSFSDYSKKSNSSNDRNSSKSKKKT